jgi:lactoylglutathione lyase
MPPPVHIHHLAIWTRDLEKMRGFYERYFGAVSGEKYRNETKGFESYFLCFSEGARLELMKLDHPRTASDVPVDEVIGLTHFALSVGGRDRVDALTEILRKDGFNIAGEPRITGDGYYESVVLDPEGNRIELTE